MPIKPSALKNDSLSNTFMLNHKDIEQWPVRGLQAYLQLLPGVTLQDGLLHIRGGGASENSFWINGFNLTSTSASMGIHLIPEAIQTLTVKPGNFSVAPYAAGTNLVTTKLKSGGAKPQVAVYLQTDKFTDSGQSFLNTYTYREHIVTGLLSGTVFDKHSYFIATENHSIGDYQERFSSGFAFNNLVDMNQTNPDVNMGQPDTIDLTYPDGFTPGNSSNRWAINLFFTFDFDPLTIRITGLYDWLRYYHDDQPMLSIFNQRDFYFKQRTGFIGADINYAFNRRTRLNVKLDYYNRFVEKHDDYFGDNWRQWPDSTAVSQAGYSADFRNAWQVQYPYRLNGFYFDRNGVYEDYGKQEQSWLGGEVRFSVRLHTNHKVEAGLNARQYTLRLYSINPEIMLAKTTGGVFNGRTIRCDN
ncbi:MAG: TonB-dependent receptor plug domain-containing protein [Caldithrix sp.]|nr:TonB-dependent receptor plug domain-containing protein [Caldithrix sp.]